MRLLRDLGALALAGALTAFPYGALVARAATLVVTLELTPMSDAGVVVGQQPALFEATVTNGTDDASYYLNFSVVDFQGSDVLSGSQPLTTNSSGSGSAQLSLAVGEYGWFEVQASLGPAPAPPSGTVLTKVPFAIVPPPSVPPSGPSTAQSPAFSVNGPGASTFFGAITPALESSYESAMTLFREQGITWARSELRWEALEPSPGTYTWDRYDGVVEAAEQSGEHLLGLLDYFGNYANPFSSTCVSPSPSQVSFSQFVSDYDQYVRAVVTRYMPGGTLARQQGWSAYGVTAWELWNEPSTSCYWPGTPEQYVALAQAAAETIHQADPSATVVAYVWPGDEAALARLAGQGSAINALSAHAYPGLIGGQLDAAYPYTGATLYQYVAQIRAFMDQNGMGTYPLWVTESGWSSGAPSSPGQQAEIMGTDEAVLLAAGSGAVSDFTWWYPGSGWSELRASSYDPPYPASWQVKPVYAALAAVAARLGGERPASPPLLQLGTSPDQVYAYLFSSSSGRQSTAVIWSGSSQGTLVLQANAPLHTYDLMDNPLGSTGAPLTGTALTVPVGPSPVYVAGDIAPSALRMLLAHGHLDGP